MPNTDLSGMGSVKYYKGFLNHAYSLRTINAQKNQDLLFRISDDKKFDFKSHHNNGSEDVTTSLIEFGKNSGIRTHVDFIANCQVSINNELSVSGDTILNGTTTNVQGNLIVSGDTNITTTGTTTINGLMTASSHVNILGDLSVGSTAIFYNDVTIQNKANILGNLTVTGDITFNSTLTVTQNTEITGDLSVSGETTINNDLNVNGNITVNSFLYASNVDVTNDLLIGETIIVNDVVTIQNKTGAAFSHTSMKNTLNSLALRQDSTGVTYIGGNSVHIKNTNLIIGKESIDINKPTTISNTLSVSGNVTIDSDLSVGLTTTFNSTVYVQNQLSVGGVTTFDNDITVAVDKTVNILGTSSVENLIVNSATIETLNVTDATMNSVTISNGNVSQLSVTGTTFVKNLSVSADATFYNSVTVKGLLSVASEAIFDNTVTINGDLSIASNKSLYMNNGSELILKGSNNDTPGTNDVWADDFAIRENNGTFEIRMCHVETDTVNYATNCDFYSESAIKFNSNDVTLKGHNAIVLETNCNTSGKVEIMDNLSVAGEVVIKGDLTVSSVAVFDDQVKIGKVDLGNATGAVFCHKDFFNSTDYGFAQTAAGEVRLNAPSGQAVRFFNAGTPLMAVFGNSIIGHAPVEMTKTLSVSGMAQFNSNVTVSGNMYLTNASTIMSDVTINGATTVNGDSTFNCPVTFNGAIISNCHTTHHAPLTVNCSAQFNDTLTVTGVTTLKDKLSVSGNVNISGELSVAGKIYAGDAIIQTYGDSVQFKHNSATYAALSQNSSGDVDIKSSSVTNFDINSDNVMSISANAIDLRKHVNIEKDLSVGNNLYVWGDGQVGMVKMITDVSNGLVRIGNAFVSDANDYGFVQNSYGNTTIQGNSHVKMNINGANKMTVEQDKVTVSANSMIVQNIQANSNVIVDGNLSVGGTSTFSSDMNINGTLSVGDNVTVTGELTVNSNVYLRGNTVISNSLTVDGDVYLNGDLIVRGSTTKVDIQSTEVSFNDNAIILAANCSPDNWGSVFNDESGLYVHNSNVGFVYQHSESIRGWQTKGSDLGIDKGHKLFFSQQTTSVVQHGWSVELDYDSTNGASENSPDMVFRYYNSDGTAETKLRITSYDADDSDDDAAW